MISIRDLYNKTNDGLDIILHYYPQARAVVGTKNKFKVRGGERTASACLIHKESARGGTWKVVDFGEDGHGIDPIDVVMREESITRIYEAVLKVAAIFGVTDELDRAVNKPDIVKRPARPEEAEGTRPYELKESVSAEHAAIMGPKVTPEHLSALGWYEAEWVGYVKNRQVTEKHSTENYPIFVRECIVDHPMQGQPDRFYKIYEPLNPDKAYRFSYMPAGAKPPRYTNGLHELREAFEAMNKAAREAWESDEDNGAMPYRAERIKEVFICSGERDALCCKSMGYFPVWFNSETYQISGAEMGELLKYAERVYNIPDIDETGIKKGGELALRFLDVHTIWLPQRLREFRDNRGKRRKDLKDWMELRDQRGDFNGLMELAMPARWWNEDVDSKGKTSYSIDTACLHYFLGLNGFCTMHDDTTTEARLVRITGAVVEHVSAKDVRQFLIRWADEHYLPRGVRNLLLNSPRLAEASLSNLKERDLDFSKSTPTSQLFFFPRQTVQVEAEGIKVFGGGEVGHFVWSDNVIARRFTQRPAYFTVTGESESDLQVTLTADAVESKFLGFVVNSSRLYWQQEVERAALMNDKGATVQPFTISSPLLDAAENRDQNRCLLNKLFVIGYMLHGFKSQSRAWAAQALDNKIGENEECNGRSGKSFFFKTLSRFMLTVKLSGRNPKLMDNSHVFDQVTKHTDMLFFDDCDKYMNASRFYDLVTSDMTVNPKGSQSFTIPFEDSPKLAFTTNYVPRDFEASTEARMLYLVFSDWYHERTEDNGYAETRSIRDDFGGRDLHGADYTEEEWNADTNFVMQCVALYLRLAEKGWKIKPPMANILQRKAKEDMGSNFEQWAEGYFAADSGNLDREIMKRRAYDDFIDDAKVNRAFYTMNRFTKALRAFCELTPYIKCLNPRELCGTNGRIVHRVDDKVEDYLYIQTINNVNPQGAERTAEENLPF